MLQIHPIEQRFKAVASYRGVGILGMIIAPGINYIFSYMHINVGGIEVNILNAPSFLTAFIMVLYLPFLLIYFKEPNFKSGKPSKVPISHKLVSICVYITISILSTFIISSFQIIITPSTYNFFWLARRYK